MALGIDLGSFDSKMVELVESNDAVKVKSMGTRPIFSDISVYSTEKLINQDLKDKISQEKGIKVTDAVKELKESLTQDTEQIKIKLEALKSLVNEITTELYKNATPPPGDEQQSSQQQENTEGNSTDEQKTDSDAEQKTDSDAEQKTESEAEQKT